MSERVLIVDDSLTVRMDLADAFTRAGFHAMPCSTLAEARGLLRRDEVHAVVLDVVLPDGDGVDFLREIRGDATNRDLPVFLLSTEADVKDRIRGLTTGADDYVGKPYDASYVVARARELLRARRPHASDRATILVIDDSTTFREGLRASLEAAGYAVLAAASGEDGLRVASTHRPTAIIVDGHMPGIEGATVIRRVRLDAALRGTPCLLLTGSEDGGAELRALDAGADAFVRKDEDVAVILARLAAILRSASASPAEGATLLGPKRVLVVDDSETFLQEMSSMLRGEGYDVVLARSGEQALEMLAVQSVDCVLLDLVMPGLSGKETCRQIKSSSIVRDIPLIIVTSIEDKDAMIEGLAIGADDYIAKSAELEVLKARVRAQIRRKQFEDEHRRMRDELLRSEIDASEARAARRIAEAKAVLNEELQRKNDELEAFSYSVSHDLRGPLRTIDGFSQALLEDNAATLDDRGRDHIARVRSAAQRMGQLIDDLLLLSRVSRAELRRFDADLSELAHAVAGELRRMEPQRPLKFTIQEELRASVDTRLMRIVLENLFGNACKFTSKRADASIELGVTIRGTDRVYFVKDNGAGFDMAYAKKLFAPFQRLHDESEFAGTGIGLATVHRIIDRHGGRVWAEAEVAKGATIFFTLAS